MKQLTKSLGMILPLVLVSTGMVQAGNVKKAYVNVGKEGTQATANDIPANYGLIATEEAKYAYNFAFPQYNGVLYGNPQKGEGKNQKAMQFNGTNYVQIGNMGKRPAQGTIEFWMKSDIVQTYRNPFSTSGLYPEAGSSNMNSGNMGIRFEESGWSANSFGAVVGNDTGNYQYHGFTSSLQANQWYHVALSWDSSQNKVWGYLNGQKVVDGATQTLWSTNFSDVKVGVGFCRTCSERWWKGAVDELMMWNTIRTPDQIQADMEGIKGNEEGLIGYWNFN